MPQLAEPINGSIAINSTAFEDLEPESNAAMFIRSKTEMTLSKFTQNIGWPNYKDIFDATSIVQIIPFRGIAWGVLCDFHIESMASL